MAVYVYTATRGGDGQSGPVRGTMTADSPRQARDQLRAQGLVVRDMSEHRSGVRRGWFTRYRAGRRHKVTGLLQEMATLLEAGIPLLEALDTIAPTHGAFSPVHPLATRPGGLGVGLAEAMGAQPDLFDQLCCNIAEVGENAGTLDVRLHRPGGLSPAVGRPEEPHCLDLMYPCIVMAVGLAVSIFLMTYVLPNVLGVLIESGRKLPMATLAIKGISDFLIGWWWALLLAAPPGWRLGAVLRTKAGPDEMASYAVADSADWRVDSQAGDRSDGHGHGDAAQERPGLRAGGADRPADGSQPRVAGGVASCERAVWGGRDIAAALEKTDAFPPLVIQVFAVGQASGRLDTMLENWPPITTPRST